MALILILFGLVVAIVGLVLFVKRRKTAGLLLFLTGSVFVVMGVVALLSFHP